MLKVYVLGNYFIVEVDGEPKPRQDGKANVNVVPLPDKDGVVDRYRIESPKIGSLEADLTKLTDENDAAYDLASWEKFYLNNSNFRTASGGSEAWDQIVPAFVGVWDDVVLPGAPYCQLVAISIRPNSTNEFVGVREVGSALNRVLKLDTDAANTMLVRTDENGVIQVYTTNITVEFFVQIYDI